MITLEMNTGELLLLWPSNSWNYNPITKPMF